jgi:hypothetical protein
MINLKKKLSNNELTIGSWIPYDLSGALGIPGHFEDTVVALKKYINIFQIHNFSMDFHVVDTNSSKVQEKIYEGYEFIAYETDFLFMENGACSGVNNILRG